MKTRGFTIFFAMLVGSLALAVGLAIFDLTIRELDLSSAATQSQYAVYAADTGVECALYWDTKCALGSCNSNGAVNSAFATSTSDGHAPTTNVICNGQDVAASAVAAGTWPMSPALATAATSSFTVYVSAQTAGPTVSCAVVTVAKTGNPSQTVITSHGYNTCASGMFKLERALQVNY